MNCLVDISQYSSMRIGGRVSHFHGVKSNLDIPLLLKHFPDCLIIGAGNNIVFKSGILDINITKIVTKGISISHKRDNEWLVKFEAGEDWSAIMEWCVKHNLAGIESLAGIPGTAGAAPVQNIGAYGAELCQVLESVEAYDRQIKEFIEIKNKDCGFGYRDSIFKRYPQRWIITAIFLKLSKGASPQIPHHKEIREYLNYQIPTTVGIREIVKAVKAVRERKIPDPKSVPNCGSFFKNPIINEEKVLKLKKILPDVPVYPYSSKFKIPAGYLIEKAGLKGRILGQNKKIKICDYNALILTNIGGATFEDLIEAKTIIENEVYQIFQIRLEPEVNIIGKNV